MISDLPTPQHSTRHENAPPTLLAIHTCSRQLGLAWQTGDAAPRHFVADLDRQLSTDFHPLLAQFVPGEAWETLDALAVAIGPGGFTSTRIGVVTARTLAQQLNCPLFGISTLLAIAVSQGDRVAPGEAIAVQMPARRGDLYTAIYRRPSPPPPTAPAEQPTPAGTSVDPDPVGQTWEAVLADTVLDPETWDTQRNIYAPGVCIDAPQSLGQDALSLAAIARSCWQRGDRPAWATVQPFYGQQPV